MSLPTNHEPIGITFPDSVVERSLRRVNTGSKTMHTDRRVNTGGKNIPVLLHLKTLHFAAVA